MLPTEDWIKSRHDQREAWQAYVEYRKHVKGRAMHWDEFLIKYRDDIESSRRQWERWGLDKDE